MLLSESKKTTRLDLRNGAKPATTYLHHNIANQLLEDIEQGRLALGDKLPSQAKLVKKHKVSVATVRQSLLALERRGIIRKEMGRGSFVSLQSNVNSAGTELRSIGLVYEVTGDISDTSAESQVLLAFANACQKRNIRLMVTQTKLDAHSGGKSLIKTFDGVPLDGVCIFLHEREGVAERVRVIGEEFRAGVLFLVGLTNETIPIDCINVDISPGTKQLMNYLISLGHKRIAYVGPMVKNFLAGEGWKSGGRWEAYTEALERANLSLDTSQLVETPYGEDVYKRTDEIMSLVRGPNPVTAIFAANDWLARHILNMFWKAGVRVPQDVSIAGLDNIDIASQLVPALTTVAIPFAQSAEAAIDLMKNRLESPGRAFRHITLNAQLIIRDSVNGAKVTR